MDNEQSQQYRIEGQRINRRRTPVNNNECRMSHEWGMGQQSLSNEPIVMNECLRMTIVSNNEQMGHQYQRMVTEDQIDFN